MVKIETYKREKFADSKVPEFKHDIGSDWVKYGDRNDYVDYLLMLYNKSAKHNAIINGKCVYIYGNGLINEDEENIEATKFLEFANPAEKWNELLKKILLDIEVFGGFALQCIPKVIGGFNYYHLPFNLVRSDENNECFYYKKDWKKGSSIPAQKFECFNRNETNKATIYYYKEYRSGTKVYPLPQWVAACNWIESDIEVSKATLTKAMTGFNASKMINFFTGVPTEDSKHTIEQKIKNKFTGSEGDTVLVTYNVEKGEAPEVLDLGSSDLTKEDFTNVDKLITSNIFAAHSVTHPLLFGIQQEGKLGSSSELKVAFDIFKNTYSNAKQEALENVVNYFAGVNGVNAKFKIKDIEPIGIDFDAATILQVAPKEWITDKLGIDLKYFEVAQSIGAKQVITALNSLSPLVANKVLESMGEDEIRSLVNLQPKNSTLDANGMPIVAPIAPTASATTNNVLTNLTGRQRQNIMAIVRQYSTGKLTKEQAALMLKSGFGFSDENVNEFLGIDTDPLTNDATQKFSSDDEVALALAFNDCGEDASKFEVIKKANFLESEEDFELNLKFAATLDVTEKENNILELLKGNPKLTNEQIATSLGLEILVVDEVIKGLIERQLIKAATGASGNVVRSIVSVVKKTLPNIAIRYSYELRSDASGTDILPTSRPFCKKMVALSKTKMWNLKEIQAISARFGYNVFQRVGGFWNNNGTIEPHCRHEWVANAVIIKK